MKPKPAQSKQIKDTQDNTLSRKIELPWVGLQPTTLCSSGRVLYHLSYQGSQFSWQVCNNTQKANSKLLCAEQRNSFISLVGKYKLHMY